MATEKSEKLSKSLHLFQVEDVAEHLISEICKLIAQGKLIPPSSKVHDRTFDERLLRLHEVESAVGYKRSTIYKLVAAGSFPASISLGARAKAWTSSSIEAWIQQRIEQSRKTA